MAPEERLQKILARAGIASRRKAEELMREGRVLVNGQVASRLGMHADADRDHIRVDGKMLRRTTGPKRYLMLYKPQNVITTLDDPEGRPTIRDILRRHRIRQRIYPVGRLDWDADGLLLLTNDGDLANAVMHPRTHLQKRYRVKVKGLPKERDLDKLRRGVVMGGDRKRTLPAEIEPERLGEGTSWLRVTLVEGRQNQIKKMFERIGHPVRRLRRTGLGPLKLGKMRVGELRALTPRELERLRSSLGLDRRRTAGTPKR